MVEVSSSIRERTRAAVRGEGAAGGGSSEDEGASSETGGGAPGGGSGAAPEGCVGLAWCRRTKRAGDRGGEGWGSRSGARSRCPRGTSRGGGGPIQMRSGPRHCAVGWAPRAELGDRRARGANVAPLGADCTMSIVRTRAPTGVSRENAGATGSQSLRGTCPLGSLTRAVGRPNGVAPMRLKLAPTGRGRGGRPRADARVSLRRRRRSCSARRSSRVAARIAPTVMARPRSGERRDDRGWEAAAGSRSLASRLMDRRIQDFNRRAPLASATPPPRVSRRPPGSALPSARDERRRSRRGTVSTWRRSRWLAPPEVRRT